MRLFFLVLLSLAPALPQARDPKCAGAPDGIFGKNKGIYFGCLNGKEVRSSTPGAIPPEWIASFDAKIREVDAAFKVAPRKTTTAVSTVNPLPVSPDVKIAADLQKPTVIRATEENVNSLALGTGRLEVEQNLGTPDSRISGDTERLTYRLTSGKLARLEFENGKLARIRIVPGQ
jgi:hypothetical protein